MWRRATAIKLSFDIWINLWNRPAWGQQVRLHGDAGSDQQPITTRAQTAQGPAGLSKGWTGNGGFERSEPLNLRSGVAARAANSAFADWADANLFAHRQPGYAAVTVSLKTIGEAPGPCWLVNSPKFLVHIGSPLMVNADREISVPSQEAT